MILDKWREFSATKHWSRIAGQLYPEPQVKTELPTELLPALEPEAKRLEEQRQETMARIDQRARWMVLLGLSPLLLVFVPGLGWASLSSWLWLAG